MSGYVFGTHAALDLEDIWNYFANDDIDAADRWIGKLKRMRSAFRNLWIKKSFSARSMFSRTRSTRCYSATSVWAAYLV